MRLQDPNFYADVFAQFGLVTDPRRCESLCSFAPVFAVELETGWGVLKRTRAPLGRAHALVAWERSLAARGVPVVAPDPTVPDNPRMIGDEAWVIYPYVSGDPYDTTPGQLRTAGSLLGAIHSIADAVPELGSFGWANYAAFTVETQQRALTDLPLRHGPRQAAAIVGTVARWLDEQCARGEVMRDANLPEADCCCDFKANNLVYSAAGPVLVDPDLAARWPRVLDLALACLLFHNEVEGGRGRLLTSLEWDEFLGGYLEHVVPTPAESAAWPDALRYMFVEQGLWLVFNEYEIDEPLQQFFLDDLLAFALQPERYPLPCTTGFGHQQKFRMSNPTG